MYKGLKYICDICKDGLCNIESPSKTYCRVSSLESSFRCALCSRPFSMGYEVTDKAPSPDSYRNSSEHTSTGLCESLDCGDGSRIEYKLEDLKSDDSKEESYKCKICPSTFKYKGGLNYHMVIHNQKDPFRCKLCAVKSSGNSQNRDLVSLNGSNRVWNFFWSSKAAGGDSMEGRLLIVFSLTTGLRSSERPISDYPLESSRDCIFIRIGHCLCKQGYGQKVSKLNSNLCLWRLDSGAGNGLLLLLASIDALIGSLRAGSAKAHLRKELPDVSLIDLGLVQGRMQKDYEVQIRSVERAQSGNMEMQKKDARLTRTTVRGESPRIPRNFLLSQTAIVFLLSRY
ncbi:Zinc finger protein 155 like protein [Argiope bruennichi]|uniref:Zinc finger protein 155 like protein n=1 Tax=Argiope bruennichi TaxID=94029 RepID=A0A8T0ET21_ARGBR|nr:Zinc finger protein 155 like protein [Argiope bruennichi]